MYDFNAKILQSTKQYQPQDNYSANYPKIQTELASGATTEGIIAFPAMDQSNFKLTLDASSDNWDETINSNTFNVAVQ